MFNSSSNCNNNNNNNNKDVASDRQKQRQLLNVDFRKLSRAANEQLKFDTNNEDNGVDNNKIKTNLNTSIENLTEKMCETYKKYPLLCKRNERNNNEETDEVAPKHKKKKRKLKNHQIKKNWQKNTAIIDNDACIRALAVAYHTPSKRIYYGMSGQSKKIKIHKSIWGKSLVKGRKRGTCAEFKVANQILNNGQTLNGLVINVVDIMSGKPKPRCRNCLYVTKDSSCLSDNLVFDGNMTKMDR